MLHAFEHLLLPPQGGDLKSLARCISLVENQVPGTAAYLQQLAPSTTPIVGITGPPGAGKSTLVDGLIGHWVAQGKRVGVLCVDPSSPFNLGALLGDRIRMSQWYTHPQVFIRSLASRGSLGGLHPHILEVSDIMRRGGFDFVVVETVGVGQSEVEIAGLADCTLVVLVPEAGDEIQTMKAGLMEIADVFVVNKADRPDADRFVKNLRLMMAPAFSKTLHEIAIVKTVATKADGLADMAAAIDGVLSRQQHHERQTWLLADKAFYLIQKQRMQPFEKAAIKEAIARAFNPEFNIYQFTADYLQAITSGQ